MQEINIAPRYVRKARESAKERNQSFEESNAWNNDTDKWGVDPVERNFRGIMGEFAFSKYAGIPADTSIVEWTDGGSDFEVEIDGQHACVDVKTANKEPKALMVKEYAVDADYYVLGHLENNTITFYGAAWADSLKNGVRKESRYGHVNYTLGVDYLDKLPAPDKITSTV